MLNRVARAVGIAGYHARRIAGRRPGLMIHLDWRLGDEIMALPLFAGLRRKYGRVSLGVRSRNPELFLHHPHVDEINPEGLRPFDRVIDIRGEDRSMGRLRYWEKLLGVSLDDRRPRIYFSREETQSIEAMKRQATRPLIAISAGATWKSKQWDGRHFKSMGEELLRRRPGLRFMEMGLAGPWLGLGENKIGQTSVREAALLLASCDLFIGNDSGLMHLAAAAGTPAIGLFGPIAPASLVADQPLIYPMWANVECRGCWTQGRMKTPDACPLGEPICMDSLRPTEVCAKALEILGMGTTLHPTLP